MLGQELREQGGLCGPAPPLFSGKGLSGWDFVHCPGERSPIEVSKSYFLLFEMNVCTRLE